MRIAFVTPEYVTSERADGGLANYVKKTARFLSQRGCEVWVFVLSQRNCLWNDEGVTICEVRSLHLPRFLSRIPRLCLLLPVLDRLLACRNVAGRFWEYHRKTPFDIVQASSYHAPGLSLIGNGKVPVVCRISSYTPLWRSISGYKRNFTNYLLEWLEIRQVAGSDSCYAPSRFLADVYQRMEGLTPHLVRTPVDSTIMPLDDSVLRESCVRPPYLLVFGTLNRVKGTDLLAEALPQVMEKHKDLSLVLIGRDDGLPSGEKIHHHITEKYREGAQRIHYFPPMQKSQLNPFIIGAEAVLLLSRVDNYPNTCLEALMLGKTVIGADNSSIEEIIRSGENGYLFKNGDHGNLQCTIEKWLDEPLEERNALSKRIQKYCGEVTTEDRIGQLLNYYDEVIQDFKERRCI